MEIDLIDQICDYIKIELFKRNHKWFNSYRFNFSTNGLNYHNDKVQNFIKKNLDHLSVTITIDGTQKLHDTNRVYKGTDNGSYNDVVKNIPLYLEQFPVAATKVTITTSNIEFIKDSVLHLFSIGIHEVNINCVFEDVWQEGDDLRLKLKQLNYGDDVIDMIFTKDYDADDVATATIMGAISELKDQIYNTKYSDYIALSDIIDAVYEGEKLDLNGNQIKTTYTHGSEYYSNSGANASFHEIIANFTQIKISGHQNSLDCIRAMFGEEFYNLLEETFSKFCNSN